MLSVTFTLKLLDFVEGFEPLAQPHFDLCTYGVNADEVSAFEYLLTQNVTNTRWRLKPVTPEGNNGSCKALYIGNLSNADLLPQLRESATNAFTLSSKPLGEQSRAMVVLYFERDRLNFDVYLHRVNERHFKLSSRVLKLASKIIEGGK